MSDKSNDRNLIHCSFCGKSQHDVKKLIAGPTVFICDECVVLCVDVIATDALVRAEQEDVVNLSPREDEPHRLTTLVDGVHLVVEKKATHCDFLRTLAHRMSPYRR
jgi:ATP-dependent protease Clp ATPase subunit